MALPVSGRALAGGVGRYVSLDKPAANAVPLTKSSNKVSAIGLTPPGSPEMVRELIKIPIQRNNLADLEVCHHGERV